MGCLSGGHGFVSKCVGRLYELTPVSGLRANCIDCRANLLVDEKDEPAQSFGSNQCSAVAMTVIMADFEYDDFVCFNQVTTTTTDSKPFLAKTAGTSYIKNYPTKLIRRMHPSCCLGQYHLGCLHCAVGQLPDPLFWNCTDTQ